MSSLIPDSISGNKTSSRGAGRTVAEVVAGAAALGVVGLVGWWLRERSYQEADYDTISSEGPYSLRRYAPMVLATTEANGTLHDALDGGFRRLSAYISGKRRAPGADETAIAMTTPVTAVPAEHPGSWKIRFGMPAGQFPSTLPAPGKDVAIEELPGRLIAAVRFSGRDTDRTITGQHRDDLLGWVRLQGLTPTGEAEFAGYNAPIIPGPVRRNEWWMPVADRSAA
jgi:SOUL heme-binding protein